MPRWLKVTIGIFGSLIILFAAATYIFYKTLTASLPAYSGETFSSEIINDIEIRRDSFAIPYITANTDEDIAFALGYIHAQERIFVMDIIRRAGEGRLSEIFGSATIPFDNMFLTIGLKRDAIRNVDLIDPLSRKLLNAYSRGVNHYLTEAKGKYPVEFDVLGYDPYEWQPHHSLIVIRMMAWELNMSWWIDIMFTHLAQKLGEEKVLEILPDYPQNAPYIIPPELKDYPKIPTSFLETDKAFRNFFGMTGTHIGSNNWVVSSDKSESGKPIIANDPHLGYKAPGYWYAVVLNGNEWKTAGVTLPGIPAVVIGKNENVAWTFTNIMLDDADFYLEKIDTSGAKYFFNGKWENLISVKDTIRVKDSSDVIIEILQTHRGPIISSIHPYSILYPDKKRNEPVISMRWTGNDFSDEMLAAIGMNKANDWKEFVAAAKQFAVPGQNFVFADKDNNIGYYFGGKLPIRKTNSPSFIYDGTTDKYDWTGYLQESDKPFLLNPENEFIATANNKVIKDFKYHISNMWEPSSRIDRITELLTEKEKHTVDDYKAYQMDFISPYARQITSFILNAFEGIKVTDQNLKTSLELFREWNYEMDQYSQVPAIYALFLKHLLENIYLDELGSDLFNEFVFVANIPYRSVIQLLHNPSSSWFNDVRTQRRETRDEIIRKSLADALAYLERTLGREVKEWQWGKLHHVVFKHAFSGASSLIDNFVDIGPFPIGGDGTTIFNTEYMFREPIRQFAQFNHKPFENVLGPSMRFIYDFNEPDKFHMILTTGQSGNIMSDHYKDMSLMWLKGEYMKIRTNEDSIKKLNERVFRILKK